MPRKQYVLTGPSFTVNDDQNELSIAFQNPRELQQVAIAHAAFTLDLGGNPPAQLTLRSAALSENTSSRTRELSSAGAETTTDVLGHVTLVHSVATGTAHFQLQRPVAVTYGNFKHKVPSMDFYLTDHTGARVNFLMTATETITRYDFAGDWLFDENNTNQAAVLTQTWGPTSEEVGGALDLPGDDWDLTGTVLLVTDNTNYTWAETDDTSGTITGATNSTWTRDGGVTTILWGGNASTWYKVEIGDNLDELIAVSDYNDIYTPGDVVWTKASGDFLSTGDSTWSYSYGNGTITIKWEDDDDQKIVADWDAESNTFVWASENWSSGFGFQVGSPVLSYSDYVYNDVVVPTEVEILEQFPHASMQLTIDAAH